MEMKEKADWERLRDEFIAQDKAKYEAEKEVWSLLISDEPRSPYEDINSEEELAEMIEKWYPVLIKEKRMTKDTLETYTDFFDRTGLETDFEKILTDLKAEIQWEQSFPEGQAPIPPAEARKNLCRNYRRNVGAQLKAMREKRGYSLRFVEEETGISRNIVSRTEAGRANTTIDTIAVLVDFYRIGIPLEVSDHTSLKPIEQLELKPEYDFKRELRELPEEDVMYQSTEHGVRVCGYVHNVYEATFLHDSDSRVAKYSNLPKYEWYGYIDGHLHRCTRWPDRKFGPFISTDTDPRFKELIEELKAAEASSENNDPEKSFFDHMHSEIILGHCIAKNKSRLEKLGILTERIKEKYRYYFGRMENIKYGNGPVVMF